MPHLDGGGRVDQVDLAQHDAIGKHDLLEGFIGWQRPGARECSGLLGLLPFHVTLVHLPQPVEGVLGIDERHDAVEAEDARDLRSVAQRADDRQRVGHTCDAKA